MKIESQHVDIQKVIREIKWKSWASHHEEQFIYRTYICSDCIKANKCPRCSCKIYDVISDVLSCNDEKKFPNLMNKKNWEMFKLKNNIEIL